MKIETKIRKLIELREEILEESKKWRQNRNPNICPLVQNSNLGHRSTAELLTGLGMYRWECPFCKEEFQQ